MQVGDGFSEGVMQVWVAFSSLKYFVIVPLLNNNLCKASQLLLCFLDLAVSLRMMTFSGW